MFWRLNMSTCPHCGCTRPSVDQKLRGLFAARVGMPARLNRRSDAASTNELATEIQAAEDVIDPRSAAPLPEIGACFWASADGVYTRTMRSDGTVMLQSWSEQWDDGDDKPRMSLSSSSVENLDPDDIRGYAAEYAARKAAEAVSSDAVSPRSASPDPRRAVGFIEFKPGEEPERWDADWDGGVK